MSDTTFVSPQQLTHLVEKMVASRGFNTQDQKTAGFRATFAMQHGLANSDLAWNEVRKYTESLEQRQIISRGKGRSLRSTTMR